MTINRRDFMKTLGSCAACGLISGFPLLSFANLPTDNRFILVILRGAMDGLAAVVPYGDANYKLQRRGLALETPGEPGGVLDLNGFFGFNPALEPLLPLYKQNQLAVFHAVASPYRERSHFDAQNLLENGTMRPGGTEGWLNRALQALGGNKNTAIAFNQQVPLVLQGKLEAASWAPKGRDIDPRGDYMQKLGELYKRDKILGAAYTEALQTQQMAEEALPRDDMMASGKAKGTDQLSIAAHTASAFLAKESGPRVAVLEAGGWDTHARQGTTGGQLYNHLSDLGKALALIPQQMGPVWNKTAVVVVTEFGRTVAENGTDGTDHGTGSVALMLGGQVNGGKVYGTWPGLADNNLYQGRDLMPTTDMRSLFKTALYAQMKAPQDMLENTVFPASGDAPIYTGLIG